MKNILVVAAHPDDELLGAGATVRRLADAGAVVHAVIMAEGLTSRADTRAQADLSALDILWADAKKAAQIVGYANIEFCGFADNRMDGVDLLDIIKAVSGYVRKYSPDTIFTHHHGDLNIDHRKTCEAVLTACRPVGGCPVERIYAFETPSSTEWNYHNMQPFQPNVYVDVSGTMEAKIKGMECYRSESMAYPHPRSPEALRALAMYRGSHSGFYMAEAFVLLREMFAKREALL